jgi:hypothetical protein
MSNQTRPSGCLRKVTKSDSVDLPTIDGMWPRALLVGTGGTATIIDGSGVTCANVPLQQGINPISIRRVLTGGTADDIWALY